MRMIKINVVLIALAILIIALPLLLRTSQAYQGTDSKALDVVAEIDPDYQPWISSFVKLPGSEIESLLFALQAALGAGILGFAIGRMTAKPQQPVREKSPESPEPKEVR